MEVTLWSVFWMIVAVVPASKFIREIFMKLIARVGSVNEEGLAGKGLGLLSLGALMLGKKGMHSTLPGNNSSLTNGDVLTEGISSPDGGSMGGGTSIISFPSIAQTQRESYNTGPNMISSINSSGPSVAPLGSSGLDNALNNVPAGYSQRDSGLLVPFKHAESPVSPVAAAPTMPTTSAMQQTLRGRGIEKAGNVGFAVGVGSGLGVPQMAPGLGMAMMVAGRTAYTATTMAGGVAKETLSQFHQGHGLDSFGNAVKNYTGNESAFAGITSMAGSIVGSPFGSDTAMRLGDSFSGATEKFVDPDYRVDWQNPLLRNEGS